MAPCALMRPNAPECVLTHPHASRCIPKRILLQCIPGSPLHPQESEGIRMLALGPLQARNSTSNCFSNTRRRVIVSTENYILGLTAVRAAKRNAATTTRIFRQSNTKTKGWRPRPVIEKKIPPCPNSLLYSGFSAGLGARAAQGPHTTAPRAGTPGR